MNIEDKVRQEIEDELEDAYLDKLISILLALIVIGLCSFGLGLIYTLIARVVA